MGVKKRKKEEKELWDDDDDDVMAIGLREPNKSSAEQFADGGLDDDSLLKAHDRLMSGQVKEPPAVARPPPAPAAPTALTPRLAPTFPKPLGDCSLIFKALSPSQLSVMVMAPTRYCQPVLLARSKRSLCRLVFTSLRPPRSP
jgi:hypothetical protein